MFDSKKYQAEYRAANREKLREYARQYRLNNPEKKKESAKKYFKKNKHVAYKRANERFKTDKDYRLKTYLRKRLRTAIKLNQKSGNTIELLGCDIEFFKLYLKSKFKDGMSWDNYGEWHIDHIRPIASFDFSKKEHQEQCFHYTNMQPLWEIDNLKKGSKYER